MAAVSACSASGLAYGTGLPLRTRASMSAGAPGILSVIMLCAAVQ